MTQSAPSPEPTAGPDSAQDSATGLSPLPRTLAGRTVLVTAERRAQDQAEALARRGAQVRCAPVLHMISHVDDAALLQTTTAMLTSPPDVVVITTGSGFRAWWGAAHGAGLAPGLAAMLGTARLVARGPKARGALQGVGLVPDVVAASETSAEIAELLEAEGVRGRRVLVQLHGAGDDGLSERLRTAGAEVSQVVLHRWTAPLRPELVTAAVHAVARHEIDVVTFTAAPAVDAWFTAVTATDLLPAVLAAPVVWAAVGPVTAAPLRALGLAPLVPDRGRLGALVRAIADYPFPARTGTDAGAGAGAGTLP